MRVLTMDHPLLAARPDLTGPGELPAHLRIGYWLERLIVSRTLTPGDRLPSEVDMADALGVSRMTLRQALGAIETKGLIDRRRGRFGGNFVAAARFEFDHTGLPGFTEQMHRLHVEAGASVIRAGTRKPGPLVRRELGLRRGESVHEVLRVRSANGEPIVLEETFFPAAVFPALLAADLTGSLYSVMRASGAAPHDATELIEAVAASAGRAELLGIAEGSPLLLITRTSRTAHGLPVEFSCDYHRPDRTRIRITSQVETVTYRPASGTP